VTRRRWVVRAFCSAKALSRAVARLAGGDGFGLMWPQMCEPGGRDGSGGRTRAGPTAQKPKFSSLIRGRTWRSPLGWTRHSRRAAPMLLGELSPGARIALVAFGDSRGHGGSFAGGLARLAALARSKGGALVGAVPVTDYTFESRSAVEAGGSRARRRIPSKSPLCGRPRTRAVQSTDVSCLTLTPANQVFAKKSDIED
jgi:hypothetical protein